MSIVVLCTCLFVIAFLMNLIHNSKNRRLYRLLEQFSSFPAYPLIGNAHLLFGPLDDLLAKIEKLMQPYDRAVYWLGPIPCVVLKKYDDIATILNQCQDRDTLGVAVESIGVGILLSKYAEWKKSRRVLSPAFTSAMVSKYFDVFQKNACILVDNLKSVADTGEAVDVMDWIMKVSLMSVIENTMGVSIRKSEKTENDFCRAIHEFFRMQTKRLQSPWLIPRNVYMLYLKATKKIQIIDQLKSFPAKILKDHMNTSRELQLRNNGFHEAESSRSVIDLLVKNNLKEPDFTETRIRDELLQIILAGVETTAVNLSFLLLMLAINQDAQQKVYKEITQIPTHKNEISESDLIDHSVYLEQCIKETLRMFSPVAITIRRTHKEIILKDSKVVPADMLVSTLTHLANQDPELYKTPSQWDPEHFSEQAIKERPKSSQLSFGYGPRYCLGSKYAMTSIKTLAIYILREYRLSTDVQEFTKQHLKMDLSIKSKIGYPVKFTSRRARKS